MKNTFAVVKGYKEGVVVSESDYGYTRAYTRAEEILVVRKKFSILTASMSISRPQCVIVLQNVVIEGGMAKGYMGSLLFLTTTTKSTNTSK